MEQVPRAVHREVREPRQMRASFKGGCRNPATYQIKGDEGYVRAKVIDSNGKVAWTQPVMIGKP